jgi:PhnB protein
MNVHPYVTFGGRCAEAFHYYQEHLGATELMMLPYRGSPGEDMAPPQWLDKIMHGSFKLGDTVVMGTDGRPDIPFSGMQACALTLTVDSEDQARRMFDALARGGQVAMPLGATFFAAKFGMVTDQFGVAWMVIYQPVH